MLRPVSEERSPLSCPHSERSRVWSEVRLAGSESDSLVAGGVTQSLQSFPLPGCAGVLPDSGALLPESWNNAVIFYQNASLSYDIEILIALPD